LWFCLRRFIKIAAVNAIIFCVLASAVIFTSGAVAAESAMRPPRRPVALVCPCFAHVRCESVAVTSKDGIALRGWYYWPETSNGKAILLLHGIGSNRQDMVALGYLFLRHGYSVLEPDLRGHGQSGGFATYGVLEENDVRAWVDWLEKNEHAPGIYGFGASLGAAVLLNSLKHESRFRAIVAESSYSDFPAIAKERITRMLPRGLQWITIPFVESGLDWVRWRYGVDLRNASAEDGLRSTKIPVLCRIGVHIGSLS
jgi:hypothetical protein